MRTVIEVCPNAEVLRSERSSRIGRLSSLSGWSRWATITKDGGSMTRKQGWRRNEAEDEYRRKLLVRARKGDSKAQAELMEKFGMRVYSDTERSNMPTYYDSGKKGSPPSLISTSNRTSIQANSAASLGKGKNSDQPKKHAKTTAKPKRRS